MLKGEGTIISSEIKTSFPFNNAVPSWNCISPLKTGIKVELRAGRDQTWTDWFEISQWGRGIPARGNGLKRSWHGYVDADILELYQDFDYIQYKITLLSLDGQNLQELDVLQLFMLINSSQVLETMMDLQMLGEKL